MKQNIKVKELTNVVLYPSGYKGAHSHRIPTLLKLSSGRLISIVDQRIENAMDCPYATINQIMRYSDDDGINWSDGNVFLKVETLNKARVSAIDSVSVEDKITKEIFLMVDTFPGGSGIIRPSKDMNPLSKKGGGLTADKKYQKFYEINSNKKYVLKKIDLKEKNQNWLHVHQLIDGNWNNTNDDNLKPTDIYVNNSYDPKTKILRGSVYENVKDFKNITKEAVCSIYDGFDNRKKDYIKPKYYVDSTAYIYLFKSKDQGNTWEMLGQMNDSLITGPEVRGIVMGPGKGLQLKNQSDSKLNGRLILPVYTAEDYEIPGHFYTTYSDDHGKTWKTSPYPNPKSLENWYWTSEGQLIEDKSGKVWAFQRQEKQNKYSLSISKTGTSNWENFEGNKKITISSYNHTPLNTVIMYGLAYFEHDNIEYALISLPTTFDRRDGKLFLMNLKYPQKLHQIYSYGSDGETFGYSTIEILEQSKEKMQIGVLYEVSKNRNKTLAWIGFEESESDYSLATEIIYKKLEIKFNCEEKNEHN